MAPGVRRLSSKSKNSTGSAPRSRKRCEWVDPNKDYYVKYHDEEWGVPVHDDRLLFEMLILEGAQAGLSWETILLKREGYRKAFVNFEIAKVAKITPARVEKLLQNPEIVRNRLKVESTVTNARAALKLQREFGSLDAYFWSFVPDGKPILNDWATMKDVPVSTPESDALSKDLKKRGFRFVGTTIMYAFMQAVGMVNDHTRTCYLHPFGGKAAKATARKAAAGQPERKTARQAGTQKSPRA